VQSYLGGELAKSLAIGNDIRETHHYNILHGSELFDTTESQYDSMNVTQTPEVSETKGYSSLRERYLANEYDRKRYELLKAKVDDFMSQKR
jgi:hypothetical protein